jgi:DNA-directed RNA polymerase subunit RPC12/RpoP
MLYLFRHLSAPWVKFGWTEQCAHRRSAGFWTNVHPTTADFGPDGLCGRLSSRDFELCALFEGGKAEEKLVQELMPPRCGEFWPADELDALLAGARARFCELEVPPLPQGIEEMDQKFWPSCCSGKIHRCFRCEKTFRTHDKVMQHVRDVHSGDQHVECARCGKRVIKRHLKSKHWLTKSCQAAFAARSADE